MDRVEQQLDLFATTNGQFKIKSHIKLIELFSGIGAQAQALKVLGADFEHWHTCEWAYNSILAYNAIHIRDYTDYSKDLTKEQLLDYLQGNISINYDEPADLRKKNEKWLRNCYNNCVATHNLMNICNVHGKDLGIDDFNSHYLISWSYPCQDLSLAGTLSGMKEGSGTRSSLCFEVIRILKELTPEQRQHTTLVMENVPNAVGTKNVKDFQIVEKELRDMGYNNHIKILNSKDYGIPQTRERVFMISCFGDYQFPAELPLKHLLGDMLDTDVDEKYFITKEQEKQISCWGGLEKPLENVKGKNDIIGTLTTKCGSDSNSMKLVKE